MEALSLKKTMSNITVCARFRPLSSKERRDHGDSVCIRCIDTETFILKVNFLLNVVLLRIKFGLEIEVQHVVEFDLH